MKENLDHTVVFILAAGLGTRLQKLTTSQPKALVEINGKPLLQYVLQKIKKQGFKQCIINLHHFPEQIMEFLKRNKNFGLHIQFSDETDELLDTGGALVKALPLMESFDNLLVHNVDIISNVSLKDFCIHQLNADVAVALLVRDRMNSRKLLFDSDMQLCGWHHAAKNEWKFTPHGNKVAFSFAFSGIHFLRKELLQGLPLQKQSNIDIYIQLAEKHRIRGVLHQDGYWYDVGKIENFDEISAELRKFYTA